MAILRIDRFLDPAACRRIRRAMDRGVVDSAEVLGDTVDVDSEVRRVASIDVDDETLADVEQRLDAQQQFIAETFGVRFTGREGTSFLRYEVGGFYLPHVDRAVVDAWPEAAERCVSVVVFLNDDIAGGELSLLEEAIDVAPEEGLLVAFDAAAPHQVRPVQSGRRDVIVDWFQSPEAVASNRR